MDKQGLTLQRTVAAASSISPEHGTGAPHVPSQNEQGRLEGHTAPAPKRRVSRVVIPIAAIATAALLIALFSTQWDNFVGGALIQTTDDATVQADLTRVSARVAGNIVEIAVDDYQHVQAGDPLMQIDPADYDAEVAEAEAGVAGAAALLNNLENQKTLQRAVIKQAQAQIPSLQSKELVTRLEEERQRSLVKDSFGTPQHLEQATADEQKALSDIGVAEASVDAQKAQLSVLEGQQAQLMAKLKSMQAALRTAKLRQGYTKVVAPFAGIVGERQVHVGDYVNLGTNLINVVPLPAVYVVANYKETQLTRVAEGQSVDVRVDTFPGQILKGYVARVSPGSGAVFSLLPPDNATGNFTKVVQRIPVRIEFQPDQPLVTKLRSGMSVTTRITTDQTGDLIP